MGWGAWCSPTRSFGSYAATVVDEPGLIINILYICYSSPRVHVLQGPSYSTRYRARATSN
jgi:hypothetical protein